jgi:ABC-type Mn2+/Zn2+ transport system ATPase subunit
MTQREADIARDLVPEIQSRLEFLEEVGLGYLTLDRGAPTLSGGEAQRIRLAAQLGSNLQGVCYVLDEPTIGLHARDNQILLNALHKLGDKGNTLVVVEHDEDTIRRADHIIDIGPSAGKRGGRLVAQGSVADVQAAEDSQTGRYLLHAMRHPLQARRVGECCYGFGSSSASAHWGGAQAIKRSQNRESDRRRGPCTGCAVHGAHLHNLQNVDVAVPLKRLVAVTGVSGSGKSTLARDVLLTNVQPPGCSSAVPRPGATPWTRQGSGPGAAPGWQASKPSTACWKSTRPPSAKPRAAAPPPTSAFGTPSASCLPTRWRPRRAATVPGASASTPAKAAAPAAKGRACAPSR